MSDEPLRILHLTAGSDAGGVSRYIHDLCAAMHKAGHQVAVAGERGAAHDLFQSAPWSWIDVSLKGRPIALLGAAATLRRWLANHPVDLIHTHYRKATLVARRLGRPLLYTLHLSPIPLHVPWKWFTDFGDHVHSPSTDGRDWLVREAKMPESRITLIPHGIDIARFPIPTPAERIAARNGLGLATEDRVALFVGRLDTPKNEDWLLDLPSAAKTAYLKILIAGDGPHFLQMHERIDREHLASSVKLLGHRDPLPLYHAADALLLPSAREGFSYVCAEAMCTGIPVLRTRTSGASELIVEGITGRAVEIDRNTFIHSAVEFLADEPALVRMGTAAAQHIRSNFTFEKQLEKTISLYRKLADERNAH